MYNYIFIKILISLIFFIHVVLSYNYKIPYTNNYLYIKKCDNYNNISIDFIRYQYNSKYYPIYCTIKDNFDNRKIDYILSELHTYWHPCLNNIYIKNNIEYQNILYNYWEDIYNKYGSCTNMDVYEYFNYTINKFYLYNKIVCI